MEVMLTIAPPPCSRIRGTAALVQMNGPVRLTASTRFQSCSLVPINGANTATPALLTSASSLPKRRPGVESRMLVSARNGAAQLCIFEQWVAPGVGAPTHRHPVEEVLTVHEGEADMWIDEQHVTLAAGQSLIVPAGRLHGFRNCGTSK